MPRVLLRFDEGKTGQPITSQIILEKGVSINIIRADVKPAGGEIIVDIPKDRFKEVVEAFRERGVTVTEERLLEVLEEDCIHCGACYSLCPADVMSLGEDYTVIFDEEKCVACGLCIDACPTRALVLT